MFNTEGRQINGQFAAGNPGGPGNMLARRQHELRRLLNDHTSEQDTVEVWRSIVNDAKGGDAVARKLFCDYVLGKPTQALEISGPDGGGVNINNVLARVVAVLHAFPEARERVESMLDDTADGALEGPATNESNQ